MHIDEFLRVAVAKRASDIHIKVGCPPMLRIDGRIVPTEMRTLTPADTKQSLYSILSNLQRETFEIEHELDVSFSVAGLARFRVNIFQEQGNVGAVFRVIPTKIAALDSLGAPPAIKKLCSEHQGLILITGPTGSGKSTTLAGMIDYINTSKDVHIITIEDPVEFVHRNKKSIITQRELIHDTRDFPTAIKYALRQDPDVILIGEMRDQETITSALKAAETGHLVLSTLHTTDAVQTINRVINAFPPHEHTQIRKQLANVLRGTIAQRLVPRAGGVGRVAAVEVLVGTPTVRDLIFKDEIDELYQIVATGAYDGMQSMNLALFNHYQAHTITLEDANAFSDNENELQQMIRGAFHGSNASGRNS
ncbi:MAG: type IV pilus twitching motility protein PilT [Candidatus Sericytochromatia bacterium]|nr:type IV pilus twitching motility protein PilT [Candidatus Sericytochromatia bacterium]